MKEIVNDKVNEKSLTLKSILWLFPLTAIMVVISIVVILIFSSPKLLASTSTNVSNDSQNSWNPHLIIDGSDNPYLVWQSETSGEDEIYFSKFSAGSWSTTVNVSNNSGISTNPRMAADAFGNLHLVWQDNTSGNFEIYYSKYNGTSWSSPENVSQDSSRSVNPSITLDTTGNPYVVWQSTTDDDTEIYFSKKNGAWSSPVNVSSNIGDSSHPQIKVDSNSRMHLVWVDLSSGKSQILYSRYSAGSWSEVTTISGSASNADFPKIAVDSGNNPQVVWQEENEGRLEIYLTTSSANGNTWSNPERVSSNSSNSKHPDIAIDGNDDTHLIWEDIRPASQGLTYRIKKGSTWKPSINITFGQYEADSPSIALDSAGNYYLAYSQITESNRDIFFSDTQYGFTPRGSNQNVEAGENVSLVFSSVTADGYSSAVLSIDPTGSPPSGYRFLDEFYFDISTNAGYSGNVTITVPYDESLLAGTEAGRVRILHWTGSYWKDITTSQNTNNKTVTGRASSLSDFVLAEGSPPPSWPPTPPTGVNLIPLFLLSFGLIVAGGFILHRRRICEFNSERGAA